MFSVTYYLELRNVVYICYMYYYYFINKCSISCFDIIEHEQYYLVKSHIHIESMCKSK